MFQNSENIYDELTRFLAFASSVMGDQAAHLHSGIENLFFQMVNDLTPDQKKQFGNNLKRARFLKVEIIYYWEVYNTTLELLQHPSQVVWKEINMPTVIKHAVEDTTELLLKDFSQFVTIDTGTEEVFVYSIYSLLRQAISSLIIWTHLLTPSNNIIVSVTQSEAEITLIASGFDPPSHKMDFDDELVCGMSMSLVELIISVLGGSFYWNSKQIIPDEDELVIRLPQKSTE